VVAAPCGRRLSMVAAITRGETPPCSAIHLNRNNIAPHNSQRLIARTT
jgi:hypothetical protein